ncbi:unnamed protein product, partial [Amoebophrya sp. A25]|eukprot:GSA25T00011653001.1
MDGSPAFQSPISGVGSAPASTRNSPIRVMWNPDVDYIERSPRAGGAARAVAPSGGFDSNAARQATRPPPGVQTSTTTTS